MFVRGEGLVCDKIRDQICLSNLKAQEATQSGQHWDGVFRHEKAESGQAATDQGDGGPDHHNLEHIDRTLQCIDRTQ